MMKKTILLSVLAAHCLFVSAFAQHTKPIKVLSVGDTLPPMRFSQLVNSRTPVIETKDYQNQLLIIDFWATWCSSCIKMFPTVEALQNQFKGKVQFLAVDSWAGDTKEKVQALFGRHPEWKFPTVYGDTALNKMFPHQGIPFYVWIKNNRLIATTGMEAIDPDTIAKALNGNFRPATWKAIEVKLNQPIFFEGNAGEPERYLYRSLLTPYMPGAGTKISRNVDENGLTGRLLFFNESIYQLITAAFPELGEVNKNRINTAEGVDPGIMQDSSSSMRNANKRLTYEAIFPPRKLREALIIMQEDMHRYLGLTVDSAMVEREVLVFTTRPMVSEKGQVQPPAKSETNWYSAESNIPIFFRGYPLKEALLLFDEVSPMPIMNEIADNPIINITLKSASVNESELKKALKPYGVDIHRESRKIRVYIIRQTGTIHQQTNLSQP